MRLSYSAVSTYQTCPLQYKFSYIDRLPAKPSPYLHLGSVVHEVLKWMLNPETVRLPASEDMLDQLHGLWKIGKKGFRDQMQEDEFYADAQKMLTDFHNANSGPDLKPPYRVEHPFKLDAGDDLLITGKIDRIDKLDSDGYKVIDYKASKKPFSQKKADEDLQLSFYALAVENLLHQLPEQLAYYYLGAENTAREVVTTRSEAQIRSALDITRDIAGRIKAERFDPVENPLCDWCDYKDICPLFVSDSSVDAEKAKMVALLDETMAKLTGYACRTGTSFIHSEKYHFDAKKEQITKHPARPEKTTDVEQQLLFENDD